MYKPYANIPDDFRRDYHDLRGFIEHGQYLDDANGDPVFETSTSTDRADTIAARLDATPRNIVFVQIGQNRYQIEAKENELVISKIAAANIDLRLSIQPKSSNEIVIR